MSGSDDDGPLPLSLLAVDNKSRIRASLYGMLVGDALAVPGHWYYSPAKLRQAYGPDGITRMTTPHREHVESFMGGSKFTYTGSIDILHDMGQYYTGHRILWTKDDIQNRPGPESTSKTVTELKGVEAVETEKKEEDEQQQPVHYHVSLQAGQNTANACLARLLMRYLAQSQHPYRADNYQPKEYMQLFYQYLTTKPDHGDNRLDQVSFHNDTYLDNYLRGLFENASQPGMDLMHCALSQRDNWSIDALDAVVMCIPIIAAYAYEPESYVMGRVIEHHMLTHKSIAVSATLYVLVPLLLELYHGADLREALDRAMTKLRPPKITGRQQRDSYIEYQGPAYIPAKMKWDQHLQVDDTETTKDLIHRLVQQQQEEGKDTDVSFPADEDVAGWGDRPNSRLATTCYCENAFTVVLYLAYKYGTDDPRKALIQNVNLGGHSTARGAVLGAILGAAASAKSTQKAEKLENVLPFYGDLAAHDVIVKEIDDLLSTV